MKKRVLSLLMAIAICLSMLPSAALAEIPGTGTNEVQTEQQIPEQQIPEQQKPEEQKPECHSICPQIRLWSAVSSETDLRSTVKYIIPSSEQVFRSERAV